MLTLLSDCHFWTYRDEIHIKDTDFGAFKYASKSFDPHHNHNQKTNHLSLCKKDYIEKRDGIVILKNRKPTRLKDNLKKIEELLKTYKIIYSEWHDTCSIRILFSNGILVYLCVNIYTGDLIKMAYDKYFLGKLATEIITDAIFTRQHILLSYNTNQVTMVYLQKPNMKKNSPEKISNMDPKIFHVLIQSGSSQKKLSRHLTVNDSNDLIVIWTKSSQSEIYPWKPTIHDQDRANIHVYKLRSLKLEPIAYCWTENDPITVEFVRSSEGCIMTLEQKVSRKSEITAEIFTYEITQGKMKRCLITSILIGQQLCCYSFSPDQQKLFIGTIDRYVFIHDLPRKYTKYKSRTDIIPIHCVWHVDSSIIMIANDRSQFQCFDAALSFIANQLISEDVTPSNLLDLSHYFAIQPNLLNIKFNPKPYINLFPAEKSYAQTDCFLFMIYENGPIGCLRFFSVTGIYGDIHNSGLTADVIIGKYLSLNQLEKGVNLLLTLNWETNGKVCLVSLHQIANYIFRKNTVKSSRNELLLKALSSFTDDLNDETKDEFGDQIIDIKRRFFFYLLRHHLFSEAFDIAKNIRDYDLFMDLSNVTKNNPTLSVLSNESYIQAKMCLNHQSELSAIERNGTKHENETMHNLRTNGCVIHGTTNTNSFAQCSKCASTSFTKLRNDRKNFQLRSSQITPIIGNRNKITSYALPLANFKSPFLNDESIKINIPKPELRINTKTNNSNGFRLHSASYSKSSNPDDNRCDVHQYKNQKLSASSRFFRNFRITQSEPISSTAANKSCNNNFYLLNSSCGQKTDDSSYSQAPDQTLGIPVAMPPLKLFPRSNSSLEYSNHSFSCNSSSSNQNANKSGGAVCSTSNNSSSSQSPGSSSHTHSKYYQHPLVSKTIPSRKLNLIQLQGTETFKLIKPRPTTSILSNSSVSNSIIIHNNNSNNHRHTNSNFSSINHSGTNASSTSSCKKDGGERNKVKFSDTIQVAVVPDITRKEKPIPFKRNGFSRSLITDPVKELADSLPLCHPNDDYLKDFNPVSEHDTNSNETENMPDEESDRNNSTIKVVHFGVV